jgi:hypothetical protein
MACWYCEAPIPHGAILGLCPRCLAAYLCARANGQLEQ